MDTLSLLRNTSKGRLEYDGHWFKDGALEEVLSKCTSPPSIPAPPKSRAAGTTPDRSLPVTGLTLTDAEHDAFMRKINSFNDDSNESDNKARNKSLSPILKEQKNSLNRSHQGLNKSMQNDVQINTSLDNSGVKYPEDDTDNNSQNNSNDRSFDRSQSRPKLVWDMSNNVSDTGKQHGDTLGEVEELVMPNMTSVEYAIQDHDEDLCIRIKNSLHGRRSLFAEASATFGMEANAALSAVYRKQELDAQRQLADALAEQRDRSAQAQRYELQCKEKAKHHAALMDARLKEAQAKKKQEEEEEGQRMRQELLEQLQQMVKLQEEMNEMCARSGKAITACKFPQHLSEITKATSKALMQTVQRLDALKQAISTGPPNQQHVIDAMELNKAARWFVELIEHGVEESNKKGEEEAEAAAKAAAVKSAEAAKVEPPVSETAVLAPATEKQPVQSGDELLCADTHRFQIYQKLKNKHKTIKASYMILSTDPNMKKYRFDLQKAVNTPVNAIANNSGSHLNDKLSRISALLQGSTVMVSGKRVSATEQATGKAFVTDLAAEKIVKQGQQQVAASHESAFPIAAVVAGVCEQVSDFGDLFLAHLYQLCPYTIPYYPAKVDGQSSEEYYKTLGYIYIDGKVEAQDKFLQRMSGFMRLYSSVLVSPSPRNRGEHPHGINQAWGWIASIMNLEPRQDITATMLYDMLAVTGHLLYATYKSQFIKLLQILCSVYLPKVKAITPAGSGGPVTRLENFLQKCIASSSVPKPSGMLDATFWNS